MGKPVSERVILCFTILAVLGVLSQMSAATPAPAWERQFRAESGRSAVPPRPLAMQVLADGSSMVVIRIWPGLTAIRYDEAGEVVSSATVHSSFAATEVAIDPFGSLFAIAEPASMGDYDFWTMKYDGLTGRPMWPAPARFNASAYDRPTAVAVDRSGDVLVTGYSGTGSNSWWATLRYDGRTGARRWGPVFLNAGYGAPADLSIDPSGDVLITGMMAEGSKPVWGTVKYRGSSGDQIWGPATLGVATIPMVCPGSCFTPYVAKSAFDSAGNVFLTVSSFQSYTERADQEWLTVKYEVSTGRTLWGPVKHNGGSPGYEAPHTLAADPDGNLIVIGFTATSRGSEGAILKYNGSTGTLIWGPVLAGPHAFLTQASLLVDGAGDVTIASTVRGASPNSSDWATARYDGRTGTLRWGPVYFDGSPYDTVHALVLTRRGDTIVTGASQTETQTLAYAGSSGRLVWGPRSFRGRASFTAPLSLLTDGGGNTIVVGASGERSGAIVKYGTDGTLKWDPVIYPAASSTSGSPKAAALDQNGDVLLTGWTIDGQTRHWETLKYSGATGALLWGPVRFDGRFGSPVSLAVDRFGDLFVIGQSSPSWAVMKYSGATGAALWGPVTYEPFRQGYAQPAGLAVDGRGDVFVIGFSLRGGEDYVWVTLKYDGRKGTPLWGPILFDGNFYGNDFPSKLAVDANGDLLVTGTTAQVGTKWATIKYSGSTGRALWGPIIFESGYGYPTALVLDGAGDVFLSGLANGLSAAIWSTIKYSGLTGSVIWGPRTFSASRGSQAAAAVAIDAGGNAIVTGPSSTGTDDNWTTVKYSGASGDALWGPDIYDSGDFERPFAVKTAGADFLVTGTVSGFLRTVRHTERLAIETLQKDLGLGYCGFPYSGTLAAANGVTPHTWSVVAGELPAGLTLDPLSGQLDGAPLRPGSFTFTAWVRDASGNAAGREFTLDVYDGSGNLRITAVPNEACLTGGFTLSVAGTYSLYRWFPSGEITPTMIACPSNPTVYAVVVTDETGCELRGAVQLSPARGLPTVERMPPILPHPRPPPPRLDRRE